jgi:hypothetical protein
MKSRGLGDKIAMLTNVTGITYAVKKTVQIINNTFDTQLDCGCDKRQDALNQKFPNKKE